MSANQYRSNILGLKSIDHADNLTEILNILYPHTKIINFKYSLNKSISIGTTEFIVD